MVSKKEKEKWLIENCLDSNNHINLSGLNLNDYTFNISGTKADRFFNNDIEALKVIDNGSQQCPNGKIINADQEAQEIDNSFQKAKETIINKQQKTYEIKLG